MYTEELTEQVVCLKGLQYLCSGLSHYICADGHISAIPTYGLYKH